MNLTPACSENADFFKTQFMLTCANQGLWFSGDHCFH